MLCRYNSPLTGLRIDLPPPNPIMSTSTPSPPLLPSSAVDPMSNTAPSSVDISSSVPTDISAFSSVYVPSDVAAASAEEFDLAEIDTEGLSALEKIYLFSRSSAGFHRVYITKALSGYLSASGSAVASSSSSQQGEEDLDRITPAEAVEYVLPLLSTLAMDEGKQHICQFTGTSFAYQIFCHFLSFRLRWRHPASPQSARLF